MVLHAQPIATLHYERVIGFLQRGQQQLEVVQFRGISCAFDVQSLLACMQDAQQQLWSRLE